MAARKNVTVVLNAQWSYLHSSGSSYLGDEKAKTLKVRLQGYLDSLDASSNTIIFTKDIRSTDDSFWKHATTQNLVGSNDLNWVESLKPFISLPVHTSRPSAVFKTILSAEIRKHDPQEVVLVGVETHSSVLFTAADLKYQGFNVVVPESLVMSKDDYLHAAAVSLLADVLGVEVRG